MSTFKVRVERLAKYRNCSINELERILGFSRNGLLMIMKRDSKLSATTLLKFNIAFPTLNLEWLMSGEGKMFIENSTISADKLIEKLEHQIRVKDRQLETLTKLLARMVESLPYHEVEN